MESPDVEESRVIDIRVCTILDEGRERPHLGLELGAQSGERGQTAKS